MAKGDIAGFSANIAGGQRGTFQPSAGVEGIVTTIGTASGAADMAAEFTDGTNFFCPVSASTVGYTAQKICVNNSFYLALKNGNANTLYIVGSWVQTK